VSNLYETGLAENHIFSEKIILRHVSW